MSEANEWTTIAGFAKILGVNPKTVYYAISSGRIEGAVKVLPNGYKHIHIRNAKALWKKNTKANNMSILNKDNALDDDLPEDLPESDEVSLHEAKRRRELAMAQIAEIELAEKEGKLVSIEEIRKAGFEAARITRDSLINIPNRIADELVSLTDRDAVHSLLTNQIYEALASLERIENVGKFD
jgi:hypothetical protein